MVFTDQNIMAKISVLKKYYAKALGFFAKTGDVGV